MIQFLVQGRNGEIKSVAKVDLKGKNIEQSIKIHPMDCITKNFIGNAIDDLISEEDDVSRVIGLVYREWGKFGPYGDVISVLRTTHHGMAQYHVSFIGNVSYPLPAIAADIVPFIFDSNESIFFVGIVRKKEPGIGKGALIGGYRDVAGLHYETALEALLHESNEEAALTLIPSQEDEFYKTQPDLPELEVKVEFGDFSGSTILKHIGVFRTGNEEIIPTLNEKRVHETSAYACAISFPGELSVAKLEEMFIPDKEETCGMYIKQVGKDEISFGLSHHEEIFKMAFIPYLNISAFSGLATKR